MPRSRPPARKPGTLRTPTKPRPSTRPGLQRRPDQALRTQVRGGRPPRFPGRTGGR